MSHTVVLLSPYTFPGQYPLTLAEEDMACWLNGVTALWHPACLWQTAEPPRVDSPYDHETPKERCIYFVPESPPSYLPENWHERVRQAGSVAVAVTTDRDATLANLKTALEAEDAPAIGWREALAAPPDMLSLFFGLAWGYLMHGALAEAMEHENLLDKSAFWADVQASLAAMGTEDAPPAESPDPPAETPTEPAPDAWLAPLQRAAQKLLSAREVLYPVAIHWLDLSVLGDAPDAPWPASAELGLPTNLVATGAALERLAIQNPERFATLKALVERDVVDVCGGVYHDREDPLLPVDSQLWNLREGLDATRRLLGREVRVYARKSFGFHPRLPQWLGSLGVNKLLFFLFDDVSGIPSYNGTVASWTTPDGRTVEGFVRTPKPADKAETYFNLGHHWFKTTREDHHATICLLHGPREQPWHRDLLALQRLAPVLGQWTTFAKYLSEVTAGEYPPTPAADDFHYDLLAPRVEAKLPNPTSGFVEHLKLRRRIDACWTYAALHRALCGAKDELAVGDALVAAERAFEASPTLGAEPGGLAEVEQQVTQALADRLQAKAKPGQDGFLLLNPCGFARRYALEWDGATAPLPIEGVVKACQLDGATMRAIVEAPALGFAWLPRSGPSGTPAMTQRLRVADAKSLSLRNEFIEVEVDPLTGGLKAIRDHKTRINRLGQRLVFNPGSRMVATKVEVTHAGPALGEIVASGSILGDQDQELADFTQRFRVWMGRPLLELRVEIRPKQPPAGYPWHAYFGSRFAWRDERAHLFRGLGGLSHHSTHPRPQSPDFLDLRLGPTSTAIFPGGLPFHQKHEGRMVDIILIPEGEARTSFDLAIALDRELPMLAAWGLSSPLAVVPTTKGPPHVGASGWLFHVDLPSVLLARMQPGSHETFEIPPADAPPPEPRDAIVAEFLELAGHLGHAEFRCLRNPTRAAALDGRGRFTLNHHFSGDVIHVEAAPQDRVRLQVEFS